MKSVQYSLGILGATLGLAGCYLPLGSRVVSEREIGSRTDPVSSEKVAIVRREVRQRIISPVEPLSDEQIGHNYITWHHYYLLRGAEEQRLRFLEKGFRGFTDPHNQIEEIEQRVLSIAGTTSWIAVRAVKRDGPYVDLEITVFDDGLRHRITTLAGVRHRPASVEAGHQGLSYIRSLHFQNGNREIGYRTRDGAFVLDATTLLVRQLRDAPLVRPLPEPTAAPGA